jgi:hypothetical protein
MVVSLQLARALTDRDLSDQLLARGVETALKLLKGSPAMNDLTQASELLNLPDIEFDEITATRVSGSVAAVERHHRV